MKRAVLNDDTAHLPQNPLLIILGKADRNLAPWRRGWRLKVPARLKHPLDVQHLLVEVRHVLLDVGLDLAGGGDALGGEGLEVGVVGADGGEQGGGVDYGKQLGGGGDGGGARGGLSGEGEVLDLLRCCDGVSDIDVNWRPGEQSVL